MRIFRRTGTKTQPVIIEDGTDRALFAKLRKEKLTPTTLTVAIAAGDKVFSLTDATGIVQGDDILLRDVANNNFAFFEVVSVLVNDVTVDTPAPAAFSVANTSVNIAEHNLAVNGAVTPQTFSLRAGSSEQVAATAHVTRIIMSAKCTNVVTLDKFADITALTNGLVLRLVNGTTVNLFNIKENLDLASLAYDFQVYQASNPAQGLNGFACRLTFAGQSKMGTALQVAPDEDLEVIVQDDLSAIDHLHIVVEGHVY